MEGLGFFKEALNKSSGLKLYGIPTTFFIRHAVPNHLCRSCYARKKRQTHREIFLGGMEAVVPWTALLQRIEPVTRGAGGKATSPMPTESKLRIYCMQN